MLSLTEEQWKRHVQAAREAIEASPCGYVTQLTHDVTGERPPYIYTVGLTGLGHPEFIISHVDSELGRAILSPLARRVLAGRVYKAGDRPEGIMPEPWTPVLLEAFTGALALAEAVYADAPLRALQVALPDTEHRYPWHPETALPQECYGRCWPSD